MESLPRESGGVVFAIRVQVLWALRSVAVQAISKPVRRLADHGVGL